MKKYYMIGNTHFDPVWLWRWDEGMASIRATFRSALERMEENESFIYSFASPPVFEWIRKTEPELFEKIAARIAEGRWDLEGWWLQPDCYGACGESYVRHGLYAQRYLLKHFGKMAQCVFNIDSFGHSPMMPQILQKSGYRYYSFVRPEPHHIELDSPLFQWEGLDGSRVLTYRAFHAYDQELEKRLLPSETEPDEMIVFGVTDHGGAPTKRSISQIEANPNAQFSSLAGYFENHDTDYVVAQELLTGDFGPYANYSKVKKLNRLAEYAALNAEKAMLIADRYDRTVLNTCWNDILFNQFHDILGGACIKDAYIDAENMLGRAIITANETTQYSLQSVTAKIAMLGKNPDTVWNLVVWNLNAKTYDGYLEAEVQWGNEFPWYTKGICLEDETGKRYACQIIREKSAVPGFRSRFIFRAEIPAVGYRVFKLIQTNDEVQKSAVDPFCVKTDRLEFRFDCENGCICSVTDTVTGRVLATDMLVPVMYDDHGDTWAFNIKTYETEAKKPTFLGFRVIETGDCMTEIKGVYSFGSSHLSVYYRFYRDTDYFDIRYRANWENPHTVLKLETPIKNRAHVAAVPAGSICRGENAIDMPLGAWVQVDNIVYAPNSMFAYNLTDKLGLTVLRSPIHGDMRIFDIDETLDYDIVDRGIVEGGIRVAFAGNPWTIAESFCNPPIVIDESNHGGSLPPTDSFCRVLSDNVALMAWKRCEDDEADVVRLLETAGKACEAAFVLKGKEYQISMKPWEIQTLKITADAAMPVDLLEF